MTLAHARCALQPIDWKAKGLWERLSDQKEKKKANTRSVQQNKTRISHVQRFISNARDRWLASFFLDCSSTCYTLSQGPGRALLAPEQNYRMPGFSLIFLNSVCTARSDWGFQVSYLLFFIYLSWLHVDPSLGMWMDGSSCLTRLCWASFSFFLMYARNAARR